MVSHVLKVKATSKHQVSVHGNKRYDRLYELYIIPTEGITSSSSTTKVVRQATWERARESARLSCS